MPSLGTAQSLTDRAAAEQKVALLLESETWPRDVLDRWVSERQEVLLQRAREAPFWAERIPPGAALGDLPLLERDDLRNQLEGMRTPGDHAVLTQRTSGSTGRPVVSEVGVEALGYASAARLRQFTWFGLGPHEHPQAGIVPVSAAGDPLLSRLADDPPRFGLNYFALTPENVGAAHEELIEAGGVRVIGANSSMYDNWVDAYAASGADARELGVELAVMGSEMTPPATRRRVADAFGCSTGDMYGAHEIPGIAAECGHGSLHVNEEVVSLEVLRRDGSPAAEGELGEVVVTSLHNVELPLLRYRLGDAARLVGGVCRCGRTLRQLDLDLGHLEEMVLRPDGSLMHPRMFRSLYEDQFGARLRAFHTVQADPRGFISYLDLDGPLTDAQVAAAERALCEYVGTAVTLKLEVDPERARARLPNGKLRSFTRVV